MFVFVLRTYSGCFYCILNGFCDDLHHHIFLAGCSTCLTNLFKLFTVEIKSEGEYFMSCIKGRYFRRIMDECGYTSPLCQKFSPFIEVIKYEPEDFISILKTSFIYFHKCYYKYKFSNTLLAHYFLSVSFGSLLLTIDHLML